MLLGAQDAEFQRIRPLFFSGGGSCIGTRCVAEKSLPFPVARTGTLRTALAGLVHSKRPSEIHRPGTGATVPNEHAAC